MLEDGDFLLLADLVEVVHVELPDEGGELLVLEVLGQDLVFEEVLVLHDEAVPVVRPLNYVAVLLLLQYPVGLIDEVRNLLLAVHPLPAPRLRLLLQLRTLLVAPLHLHALLRLLLPRHPLLLYRQGFNIIIDELQLQEERTLRRIASPSTTTQ